MSDGLIMIDAHEWDAHQRRIERLTAGLSGRRLLPPETTLYTPAEAGLRIVRGDDPVFLPDGATGLSAQWVRDQVTAGLLKGVYLPSASGGRPRLMIPEWAIGWYVQCIAEEMRPLCPRGYRPVRMRSGRYELVPTASEPAPNKQTVPARG